MKLAWFISPKPVILWIGQSSKQYPHSFELCELWATPATDEHAKQVMKHFALNEHYYKYDLTTNWIQT